MSFLKTDVPTTDQIHLADVLCVSLSLQKIQMNSTELFKLLRTSSTNFLVMSRRSLRRFVYDDFLIGIFYVACRVRYLLAIFIDPERIVNDITVIEVVS